VVWARTARDNAPFAVSGAQPASEGGDPLATARRFVTYIGPFSLIGSRPPLVILPKVEVRVAVGIRDFPL
jgi:hypothetical protein